MTTVAKGWKEARLVGRRVTYGCLLPLCALFTVIFVGMGMPAAINAAQGEGQAGTFIAEHRSCAAMKFGVEVCSWYGTFNSADGSRRVADVLLDADSPHGVGDGVAVLYGGESDPPKVYLADGSRDWLWGLALLVGGIGYLAWGGWRLLRSRTRPRVDSASLPPPPGTQPVLGLLGPEEPRPSQRQKLDAAK